MDIKLVSLFMMLIHKIRHLCISVWYCRCYSNSSNSATVMQKTTERQADKDNKPQKSQQAGRWEDVKLGDPEKLDKKVRFAPPQSL